MKVGYPVDKRTWAHGNSNDAALCRSKLLCVLDKYKNTRAHRMKYNQNIAINMIFAKISRIALGDPNHEQHWRDIQTYAKFGGDECGKGEL